jgi:hypothetical protein
MWILTNFAIIVGATLAIMGVAVALAHLGGDR